MTEPSLAKSSYLSDRELKGLVKLGNIMLPRNDPFPSFSDTGCVLHIDDAVRYLDPRDLGDLKLFFRVIALIPSLLVRIIVRWIGGSRIGLLRLANLGIRGIVFSLYYGNKADPEFHGKSVFHVIDYGVRTVPKGK
ncbi:MAG TPA: hypothetical protein VJ044_07865 [Candidatus Hodarchaeales archaeon]|nr:hypothetical protein [Candidatus Hodarchaeales archaeon]